jgi:hypothetical protein
MGGKGGGDAPNQYQQPMNNPMIDELAKQDLTVKALYQGTDPLVKTQGQDEPQNPITQQPTAVTPTKLPPADIGTNQGLGDALAKGLQGSGVVNPDEAAPQKKAAAAANLAQGA